MKYLKTYQESNQESNQGNHIVIQINNLSKDEKIKLYDILNKEFVFDPNSKYSSFSHIETVRYWLVSFSPTSIAGWYSDPELLFKNSVKIKPSDIFEEPDNVTQLFRVLYTSSKLGLY